MTRFALLAAIALATPGCFYSQGGSGASRDTHTFDSSSHFPKTVSLIDTRTDETIWSMEIPVGKRLVVRFVPDKTEDPYRPDQMRWEIMTQDTFFGTLDNAMPVPDATCRLLKMELRETPEMPEIAEGS